MRTPMAIAAANGPLLSLEGAGALPPSRRELAPIRSVALAEACTCEAAMSLLNGVDIGRYKV